MHVHCADNLTEAVVSGDLSVMQDNLTQINATLGVVLTLGLNLHSVYELFNQVLLQFIHYTSIIIICSG